MNFHDPGSGLKPRNSGLKGSHIYAQPFLTSNGTWPTSLLTDTYAGASCACSWWISHCSTLSTGGSGAYGRELIRFLVTPKSPPATNGTIIRKPSRRGHAGGWVVVVMARIVARSRGRSEGQFRSGSAL